MTSMGITSVVVTHVMESVRRIADHILLLHQGEIILEGTVDDLLASEDPRVRQFRSGDLDIDIERADVSNSQTFLRDLLM